MIEYLDRTNSGWYSRTAEIPLKAKKGFMSASFTHDMDTYHFHLENRVKASDFKSEIREFFPRDFIKITGKFPRYHVEKIL